MDKSLIAQHTININASSEKIWNILTNPEHIKLFLFGTEVSTDWKVGSEISFKGEYNEMVYHDKGVVLENTLFETLKYSYWSSMSGLEDKPGNYSTVSYLIKAISDSLCEFTWHQQGFSSEEGKCHTEDGLIAMLGQIKTMAEK